MAGKGLYPVVKTKEIGAAHFAGQVIISGTTQGVTNDQVTTTFSGTVNTVLSGANPYAFTSSYSCVRQASGVYGIRFKETYEVLAGASFTPVVNRGDFNWVVKLASTDVVAARWDDATKGGVNQVGLLFYSGSAGTYTLADPTGSLGAAGLIAFKDRL